MLNLQLKIMLNVIFRTLLNKVAEILPQQLKSVAPDETYNVGKHPESAALTVSGGTVTVSVTLTSPLMRDPTKTTAAAGNFIVFHVYTGQEKDNRNECANYIADRMNRRVISFCLIFVVM